VWLRITLGAEGLEAPDSSADLDSAGQTPLMTTAKAVIVTPIDCFWVMDDRFLGCDLVAASDD
jgi:hypothetical protein